jgi:hypothetical protein
MRERQAGSVTIDAMKGLLVACAATLTMALLATQMAEGEPTPQATGPEISHKQVLHIALVEARNSADKHPKRIEMASGTLKDATSVTDPAGGLGSAVNGEEPVDVVVMHGYFHVNGSPPRGDSIAPGKVLELIIDAHAGFVQGLSLSDNVPVPLSHLGPVTRLR